MAAGSETPEQVPATKPTSSRDAGNWATAVTKLKVGELPPEAMNRNVEGRRVMSPLQGFGKMWQKTYRISVGPAVTPQQLISTWKREFPSFWPANSFFYAPLTGIAPGDVAVLNMTMPGKLKLSTGVLVLYADDESFTLMTPEGHMFAGWITFSAYRETGLTIAQAQVLMRANDPIYELGLTLGGHGKEDRFWAETLGNLAEHFGAEARCETTVVCVDKKRQWKRAKNIWKNSAMRTGLYMIGAPARALMKAFKRSPKPPKGA